MIETILIAIGYLLFLLTLTVGGNLVVKLILNFTGINAQDSSLSQNAKAGRIIGSLERIIIVAGLLLNTWEVLLAVVAFKTIARHKELDQKADAEYFLIGSFASILVSIVLAISLKLYDAKVGYGLISWLTN